MSIHDTLFHLHARNPDGALDQVMQLTGAQRVGLVLNGGIMDDNHDPAKQAHYWASHVAYALLFLFYSDHAPLLIALLIASVACKVTLCCRRQGRCRGRGQGRGWLGWPFASEDGDGGVVEGKYFDAKYAEGTIPLMGRDASLVSP